MAVSRGRLHHFQQRLAQEAWSNLAGVVGDCIPCSLLARLRNWGQRQRLFSPSVTFWNFLGQVLSPGQPCRETVRQIQATRRRRRTSLISSGTSAYCQARRKLPEATLQAIWQEAATQLGKGASPDMLWRGFRVAVMDGTGVSMPDTAANQDAWPQPSAQKPGCGFPVMKLVALFSLATGAAHALVTGTLHDAEPALFPRVAVGPDLRHAPLPYQFQRNLRHLTPMGSSSGRDCRNSSTIQPALPLDATDSRSRSRPASAQSI